VPPTARDCARERGARKAPGQPPGDITADKMDSLADRADRYSFGEIRVSHRQNLVLPDVKQSDLYELWTALDALELATPNLGLLTYINSCAVLHVGALVHALALPVRPESRREVLV